METPAGTVYRFGPFEVDTSTGELLKHGKRIGLQEQPFRLLVILIENSGEVVTRAEIQSRIWEQNTFVDFDSSLRVAIGKLRTALGDDAANPRYIETIPRRGYRFLGPATQSTTQPANSVQPAVIVTVETSPVEAPARTERLRAWRSKRWTIGAVSLLLGAIGAAAFLYVFRSKKLLTGKEMVVIAEFSNATGDPVFDETLRQGMTIELEQSPFLSLLSDGRIQHALRLMGQPADARLTPEIARELCERTGSAAVLDGSIASLGSHYVVGLRLEYCRTGDLIDEEQAQADKKEDVLNALGEIASKFRARVGESLKMIEEHDVPLAEATTSSLEALKAYTAGERVNYSSGAAASIPFLKHAIEIDPQFAMAYALLGRVYGDIGETELSAESSSKAYELRNRVSDEERYWISASFDKLVTGDLEKAQQSCELWAHTYPRAVMPRGFLSGNISLVRGNYNMSVDEARIAIGLDADVAILYSNLALSLVAMGNLEQAEDALKQASQRGMEIPDFIIQRYMIAFLRQDQAEMVRISAQAREKPELKEWMSNSEGFVLAYAGQLKEARKMSRQAIDLARAADRKETVAHYETDAALREALFGNGSEARQNAQAAIGLSNNRDVEYGVAFSLASTGDIARSRTLTEDLARRFPLDTEVRFIFMPTLRALLALKGGTPSKAIELLQTALPYEAGMSSSGGSEILLGAGNLYPAYARGEAYLSMSDGREAAVEFQKILDHRGIVLSDPIGALAHLQIARAYELAGDKDKARSVYRDFLTLWKDADPNIPVLNQAKAEYAKLR
jgi:DNA-binding winged helix-turn-helix (wHTH) protein/tetratricopeptide (TPR) repeat protein